MRFFDVIHFSANHNANPFRFVWPNIFLTVTPFYPEKGVTLLILYLVWFGMQNVVLQISILVFVVLCLHTSGWKRRPADA